MTGLAVEISGLTVEFSPRGRRRSAIRAVQEVDLAIAPGSTLGIAGESGSGKSTVARALMRITPIQGGTLQVDGEDVTNIRGRALAGFRKHMQMVFQDPYDSLNPRMTVGDAVGEALAVAGVRRPDQLAAVRALFDRVGLPRGFADRYPHQLSGGQRQRVSIARSLAVEPKVLICDEAVSALDVSVRAQILNLLKDLQRDDGLSYLFISHDLSTLRFLADRVAIMYFGRIVEIGSREEVFGAPAHPYTQALLRAVPVPGPTRVRPRSRLAGEAPSHSDPPTGCAFHPRCPIAQQICREQRPVLRPVSGAGRAACHFPSIPGGAVTAAGSAGEIR